MDDKFDSNEILYRGLHKMWIEDNDSVSSAAFKDSGGISVDRDGGRDEQKCIDRMLNALPQIVGVCRLTCGDVEACDAKPVYRPFAENPYHSEIHDSVEQIKIKSKSKAKKLANKSQIVYRKEDKLTSSI